MDDVQVVRRVVFSVQGADSPDAKICLERYFAELDDRFPGGFAEHGCGSADAAAFEAPAGGFLVAYFLGRPVACGGIRGIARGVGEIKRMWVEPELRGAGLGRNLLQRLEVVGKGLGMVVLRLDTSCHLREAIRLYESSGYRRIRRYNDNQHASLWFEKQLQDRSG